MRIVIPVSENIGKESPVAYHFGRAPYFAVYDSEKEGIEIRQTRKEISGGRSRLATKILKYPVMLSLQLEWDVELSIFSDLTMSG